MIPTNSIEMPSRTKIPTTAQATPSRPSNRPAIARKPTEFLSKTLFFHRFSQDSKNKPGKSNEGIATETALSTTVTTPRACPARSLALAANP
jgi:hypothetical protein